ncbi:MAG: hypothetical protein IJZ68_08890 [Bacteroidaceae bacterium]|nr:hypothetical protein [Bacteroidaceae bacterium]
MCHENPNIERALAEVETAAEQLSMVQQNVNTPLLDILFKLVNYPQTPGLAGGKVKVHRVQAKPTRISVREVHPGFWKFFED